jgi:hypothetical protein
MSTPHKSKTHNANKGTLDLAKVRFTCKDDIIPGDPGLRSVQIVNRGSVDTLAGNDQISGTASSPANCGIFNRGGITTGFGDDSINGTAGDLGKGIANYGTINTGAGDDTISGTAGDGNAVAGGRGAGINNNTAGVIDTGAGDDIISGTAGDGGAGIVNLGRIDTGLGDDIINGAAGDGGVGIVNVGTIDTGAGDDAISGTAGDEGEEFAGFGSILLGSGNDSVIGFGSGTFDGGLDSDTLFFNPGEYQIAASTITRTGSTASMNVTGFEFLAGVNGGLSAFDDGVFSVDASGIGAFA